MAMDTVVFDAHKLARTTARLGLLRGEVGRKARLSNVPTCTAFQGRPVSVKSARSIAQVLGVPLADLLVDESEAVVC
jgi:hypothetical protein